MRGGRGDPSLNLGRGLRLGRGLGRAAAGDVGPPARGEDPLAVPDPVILVEQAEPGKVALANLRRVWDAGIPVVTIDRAVTDDANAPIETIRFNRLALDADAAGRPQLVRGTSQMLFGGMGRLSESSVLNLKNKSFSITAEVVIPDDGAEGVIIAQGGRFGGWSVYTRGGRLKFTYNVLGLHEFTVSATEPAPTGKHQVRMEFVYDGGGLSVTGSFRSNMPTGSA